MRGLSPWLTEHVVTPLNGLGLPIDLGDVQAAMLLLPGLAVAAAFLRAWRSKSRQMKDAGM